MNEELLQTLCGLRSDPTLAVQLYPQLYAASLLVAVRPGSETSLRTAQFLSYDCPDGLREVPIFTFQHYVLRTLPKEIVIIVVPGKDLWPRLLEGIVSDVCQAAVDPGHPHGIRLRPNMILGMISAFGSVKRESTQ